MSVVVDLNADLGEGFGDDEAVLECVTSTSLACGGHAGGGTQLMEIARLAVARGVSVGAHPSYADRLNFGRISQASQVSLTQLTAVIAEQVSEVVGALRVLGAHMSHVKAHGALYHDICAREDLARAFLEAVSEASESSVQPAVIGPTDASFRKSVADAGLRYLAESFVDRRYGSDGRLLPRSHAQALVETTDAAVEQALSIVLDRRVRSVDGSWIDIEVDTLCVHGDSPDAVTMARAVRRALENEGVTVRSHHG